MEIEYFLNEISKVREWTFKAEELWKQVAEYSLPIANPMKDLVTPNCMIQDPICDYPFPQEFCMHVGDGFMNISTNNSELCNAEQKTVKISKLKQARKSKQDNNFGLIDLNKVSMSLNEECDELSNFDESSNEENLANKSKRKSRLFAPRKLTAPDEEW